MHRAVRRTRRLVGRLNTAISGFSVVVVDVGGSIRHPEMPRGGLKSEVKGPTGSAVVSHGAGVRLVSSTCSLW